MADDDAYRIEIVERAERSLRERDVPRRIWLLLLNNAQMIAQLPHLRWYYPSLRSYKFGFTALVDGARWRVWFAYDCNDDARLLTITVAHAVREGDPPKM